MWQQQQQQSYLRVLPSQHPQQHTHHPVIGMDDRHNQRHHQYHHQQYQHHQHHQHHRAIMDLPVPSNPRASRNMAEKQRRDNLNTNIAAMASLLPVVAGSSRRMDKISVLRLAAAFLRTQYTLGHGMTNFLPSQFNEFDLEQYFVNYLVDSSGFFIVVTAIGKIIYVSRQVEQHLGHIQNELLGQSLYDFTYSEDHEELKRNLTPDGMRPISPTDAVQTPELVYDNNSSSSENSTSTHRSSENTFREQRRNFKIRLAQRTVSKREHTQYEWFDISGVLRLADACKNSDLNGNKGKYREKTGKNDIVFAGVATVPKKRPITELSIMDANKDEYVTRHLVDGRIIYCDHRISVIAGYMSEEVSGLNAFAFMHKDDFRWTMIGLRQMYDHAETFGSSCYRLLTKTGEFIYLRTHGYLEYDKDTHTVESFVCINTLVSEEEGNQLIKEMKGRFSATVSSTSRSLIPTEGNHSTTSIELGSNSSQSSLKCSLEDPTQLEDAITHLISDLPSPTMSDEAFSPSPMPNTQYMKAAILSSRLPPVATQLNKLSKVDRFAVIKGKRDRTLSQESEQHKHTIGKLITPSSAEQSPISDSEGVKSSGKPLSMLKMMNTVHNSHDNVQSTMSNIHGSCKSNTNACMSHNHTSFVDTPHSANVLHEGTMCNIKLERDTETYNCLPKQEPLLQYFDDSASDSSIVSSGIISPGIVSPRIETHNRCALKRICSDEDISIYSKKRTNDEYNDNDEHQGAFHLKLRTITAKNNPTLSIGFQQCNTNSQPLMTAASPSSSLQETGTDYQQLVVDPLIMTHSDEEQFTDLQDLKDGPLLSPDLAATPDLMMKIFDDLHNKPVMDFEISGGCNEAKAQQSIPDDRVINDEIRRTYRQLATSMALRESQINVLARDLENPALCAQRENLSQLQAEHNMQKQMLRTLQHDHHKMQASTKPNLEV